MLVVLPFFMAGAVDDVGIVVDALSDAGTGAAGAAAFFLFFFVLAAGEGTMGGGGRGHKYDLDLVAGRLCNVRSRQKRDMRSCGGSAVILLQDVHWRLKEGCVSVQEGRERS